MNKTWDSFAAQSNIIVFASKLLSLDSRNVFVFTGSLKESK